MTSPDARTVAATFYDAFARGDGQAMSECYSSEATFTDNVFGTLDAQRAKAMWRMLTVNRSTITYEIRSTDDSTASVDWVARYAFGEKKRPVVNRVHAELTVLDGRIVKHVDTFAARAWARQALGPVAGAPVLWRVAITTAHKAATQRLDAFIATDKRRR